MDIKEIGKTFVNRPKSFGFDLKTAASAASSGYASAENSTEHEHPPFDWDSVYGKLEDFNRIEEIPEIQEKLEEEDDEEEGKIQVTLYTHDPVQYVQTDCTFNVEVNAGVSAFDDEGIEDSLDDYEVWVVGPSGYKYKVIPISSTKKESKIISRRWSHVIYSFRPLECGLHTCYVETGCDSSNPNPLTITISRKYQDETTLRPIITSDIEFPNEGVQKETFEPRKPWGLCSNTKTEQLIVADREKHEIIVFTPDGEIDSVFGKHGSGPGEFYRPTAVAYNSSRDEILVADKDNHRIQIFSSKGDFISMFGRKGHYNGQFFFPWGLAVSNDGRFIAVADSRNHRVQLFSADGEFLRQFKVTNKSNQKRTSHSKSEFDYPRGICFDNTGNYLYVTDFNTHSLVKIDINSNRMEKILTDQDLKRPQGLTVDDAGNILICDSRHNSIKVLTPDGNLLTDIDKIGQSKVELPLDISIMKGGYLAVLDMNGRVRIF